MTRPLGRDYFPAPAWAFLRKFRRYEPTAQFLVCKLRRILRTTVRCCGPYVQVEGRDGRVVNLRAPSGGPDI